uniref:Uncharacterized protein n=1 Tax=Anopheles merus TaxID=30066 RepID=A0A182UT38_ANOME
MYHPPADPLALALLPAAGWEFPVPAALPLPEADDGDGLENGTEVAVNGGPMSNSRFVIVGPERGNFRTDSPTTKSSKHTEHCSFRSTCSSLMVTVGIAAIRSFSSGGGPELSIWLSSCVTIVSMPSRPQA